MNAEIFCFRSPSGVSDISESELETIVTELKAIDVNVLYKTVLSEAGDKITESLKESANDKNGIKMVIMVNAVDKDSKGTVYKTLKELSRNELIIRNAKSNSDSDDIADIIDNNDGTDGNIESDGSCPYEKGPVSLCSYGNDCDCFMIKHMGIIVVALPKESVCGVKTTEMVCSTVSKALTLDNAYGNMWDDNLFKDDMSDVLATVLADSRRGSDSTEEKKSETAKKKKPFIQRIIPWKGDGVGEVIRKVILIAAVFTFIFSGIKLIRVTFLDRTIYDSHIDDLRKLYYDFQMTSDEPEETESQGNSVGDSKIKSKWRQIYAKYPNLVGWINVSFSKWIDLPVFQPPADDPNYYLYRDYDGRDNRYGSLFLDTRSTEGVNSKNIIIHGHHMADGSMFADITKYQYMDNYVKDPAFTFDTIYNDAEWKVISVFKTNTLSEHGPFFNYLRGEFSSDSDFLNYVYQVRARSIITTPVDVNENDQLITLSTCSYEFTDFRTVVVARRVRKGESAKVDTSQAYYTSNPLYPDVWYKYNSGTKPTLTSFEQEYANGNISWYDGNGTVEKLDGKYVLMTENDDPSTASSSTSSSSKPSASRPSRSEASSNVSSNTSSEDSNESYSSQDTTTSHESENNEPAPSQSNSSDASPSSKPKPESSKPSEPTPPESSEAPSESHQPTESETSSEEVSSDEPQPSEPDEPDTPSESEPESVSENDPNEPKEPDDGEET